jgi:DNA-binding CsgD family transcriptional regulator
MNPGTRILLVKIPKATLEEHARVLLDVDEVDGLHLLPEALPSSGSGAATFRRYVQFLHAASMEPDSVLHDDAAYRSAEQMLVAQMLALGDGQTAPASAGGEVAGHLRRAEEFIDGHLDDDIGVVDIARSAGVDARTLEAGFRRRRGEGPMAWLDRRRAEEAARELAPTSAGSAAAAGIELTPRELEIARLVAKGLNNVEIALCLDISRNTVKEALKRIFRKAEVDSRSELVARLAEASLLKL